MLLQYEYLEVQEIGSGPGTVSFLGVDLWYLCDLECDLVASTNPAYMLYVIYVLYTCNSHWKDKNNSTYI